jgi:hypothetical protein
MVTHEYLLRINHIKHYLNKILQKLVLVCVGCILFDKSLSCKVVVFIRDVVYFRVFILEKCFKMFKEDSVQFQLREVGSHDSV